MESMLRLIVQNTARILSYPQVKLAPYFPYDFYPESWEVCQLLKACGVGQADIYQYEKTMEEREDNDLQKSLLIRALLFLNNTRPTTDISIADISAGNFCVDRLRQRLTSQPEDALGLHSDVLPGRHLFMMDFTCPCTSDEFTTSLGSIGDYVSQLGLAGGFIVQTGFSFHFYSLDLYTKETWRQLMIKSLGFPDVDDLFVRFCLQRGKSVLRISDSMIKICQPEPVALVGGYDLRKGVLVRKIGAN